MKIRDYVARVKEINNYLPFFPRKNPATHVLNLGGDKLLDLLDLRVPIKWQKEMHLHSFKPLDGTIRDFVEFWKRLEISLDEDSQKLPRYNGPNDCNQKGG